jgi:NAD(P)H-hydrate epimerase
LLVAPIGIPADLPQLQEVDTELITLIDIANRLPKRRPDSHKGSFGRAMVIAGSVNYAGAAYLAGAAAYRAGAGLVRMAVPQIIYPIVASQLPEAVWTLLPHDMGVINSDGVGIVTQELAGIDALLLGPGLGRDKETANFVRGLFMADHSTRKGHIGFASPTNKVPLNAYGIVPQSMVIDADGLNLLSEIEHWPELIPPETVLTPHVGEMARLCGLEPDAILADRIGIARSRAQDWRCVVVLKGAYTVIAGIDGRVAVAPFSTDALATAGTGDVLAGCILGMRAQGSNAFDAATIGVFLHGLAGTIAGKTKTNRATIASDVLNSLPDAIRSVESLTSE